MTGQLHVQLAKARGASPVIGVTRSADKRALAETLGADLTIPGGEGAIEQVREATQGRGADVVIETTGVLPSVSSSIHMARSGGRLLLFGIITAKEGALPFYDLYFKELALISARVAKSEDYPAAIALVESGDVKLEPLVSNVMPLGEAKAAIGMLGSDSGRDHSRPADEDHFGPPVTQYHREEPMTRLTTNIAAVGALLAIAGAGAMIRAQQPAPPPSPEASARQADLVLSNGKIITVDERFTIAQAVAIRGDRIVAVGTNQEIARLAGPNTRRIDLGGRPSFPG